jgi:hypothetical protein
MTGFGRASRVAPMRKPLSTLTALIIGFVGLGLSPALAVDERVIDVVAVTWPGAPVLPGDASEIARLINTEVMLIGKSSQLSMVIRKIAQSHLLQAKSWPNPLP